MSRGRRRSAARLAAVQALYQLDVAGGGAESVVGEFNRYRLGGEAEGARLVEAEPELFGDLVLGVTSRRAEIDERLDAILSDELPLAKLELLIQAILRAGAYELLARQDIDPPLTISEYVDVANSFFVRRESTMVNGVLDKLAREIRPDGMGDRPHGERSEA
ncbi:MAG: transcription antitermination factor NusB [Alphaproteobacteria bacterium]|nr:transcription antitermination factor NusB [Alphaproteobacteria bacterium]